mgnify:FL=1|jgi:hypothetical protein
MQLCKSIPLFGLIGQELFHSRLYVLPPNVYKSGGMCRAVRREWNFGHLTERKRRNTTYQEDHYKDYGCKRPAILAIEIEIL